MTRFGKFAKAIVRQNRQKNSVFGVNFKSVKIMKKTVIII